MADLITILGSDRFAPVFDTLTDMLSIKDVIALTRTCRKLSTLYRSMVSRRAWDIDTRLKRFVKDPQGLRKRMADLDGIISGGFALQFMSRETWPSSDLDICMQAGEKADGFIRYLEEAEGYDLASRKVGKYGWMHVDMVYQYDKQVQGERRQIEVVLTIEHPIHSTLATYTTALVNIITKKHAYCVFPMSTMIKGQTFPMRIPDYFNGIVLAKKYQNRGWKFIQRLPQEKETTQELDQGKRRIGDRFTWKMALSSIDGETAEGAEESVDGLEFEVSACEDQTQGLEWLQVAATR